MSKETISTKQSVILSFISTSIFFIISNGYRLTNTMYSHDSLLLIHQNDAAWQIALGRFIQPILVFLRGGFATPFLISSLAIIWIGLSVYLVIDFLEIKSILSIILIAAIMTCNSTVLATSASYIFVLDIYTFALFLTVFGVWMLKKKKLFCSVIGILALAIALGTYQAYICVAIGLVMIHFLFLLLEKPKFKDTATSIIRYLICFSLSAVAYFIFWKIFQKIFGIWTANSYNGLSSVGDYTDISLLECIKITYGRVFDYLINPEVFATIPFRGESLSIIWLYILRACNLGLISVILLYICITAFKHKTLWWHKLAQLFIIIIFPLGINLVCIISKGMLHTLMIYAFCLIYILAVKILDLLIDKVELSFIFHKAYIPCVAIIICVASVCWSNIVYSNQIYLKKELQSEAIYSLMTRIVYSIESTDGYVAGVTPVAITGSFENAPVLSNIEGLDELVLLGMGNTPLTYMGTDYAYLSNMLKVNINLTRVSSDNPAVKEMAVYPNEGSVKFIEGILVVKVSE